MKTQMLVERYSQDIKGVIACLDRLVLFGTYKAHGPPMLLALWIEIERSWKRG